MRTIRLIAVVAALAVVALPASAQRHSGPPAQLSDKEKAALAEKHARDKAIDAAYRATLKNMPDKKEKADPWGNLRAPGGN